MRWHWAFPFLLSLPFSTSSSSFFLSLFFFPSHSDGLHVVGRQHALLASALHAAVHPALVNLLHVYDHVSVHEGHLVLVGSRVVIHSSVPLPSTWRWGGSRLARWFRSRLIVEVLRGCRRLVSWRGVARLLWGLSSHLPLLKLLMVLNIADLVLRFLNSLQLWCVCDHVESFPFILLKILPVKNLALHLALLFETEVLWSVSHTGEVCLGVVSVK